MVLAIAGSVVGAALLIALAMVVVLRRARRQRPEATILPKSPAATPTNKADGWKAPAKATQKIITPADKSKKRKFVCMVESIVPVAFSPCVIIHFLLLSAILS